jgi:topoisomerase-4 subunit B
VLGHRRFDDEGRAIKKPVMATKDLRFFDLPGAQQLPDGHPRRKMSVVAAPSEWRVHIDRGHNGSWIQRYEDGIPVTGLVPIADDGTRGTTVRFLAHKEPRAAGHFLARDLLELTSVWLQLSTVIDDEVSGNG